jgi:hypothetical protein
VRLLDAEFVVPNPAPAPPRSTNWQVEKFPITNTNGNVAFTLKGIKIKHRQADMDWGGLPEKIEPEYEVTEEGKPSQNWQVLDMSLFDSSGNFASETSEDERFLCPHEDAWKLRVKVFGSEQTRYASNTTWTLRGLKIPAAGSVTPMSESHELEGITERTIVFAGPGEYVISNGVPVKAAMLTEKLRESSVKTTYNNNSGGFRRTVMKTFNVKAKTAFLMAEIGDITEDQRLTVRATDEQGRDYYAHDWNLWSDKQQADSKTSNVHYMSCRYNQPEAFLSFDLPPDVKTVDLTFCIHTCAVSEFIFKPPMEISAITNAAK